MKLNFKFAFLFFLILLIALMLRLPQLAQRPMHTDEAVHAIKFGALLEKDEYHYDRHEYHGPTLNYFTLIPAWLTGKTVLADTTEALFRVVPLLFGLLLIGIAVFLVRTMGWPAVLLSSLLAAISPAMVYYSRYYIQEMLLVCFSFGVMTSGWLYFQKKRIVYAIGLGIFLGLCHATKETCILNFAAMALSLLVIYWFQLKNYREFLNKLNLKHLFLIIFVALSTSALLYSSFFTHPVGILDSYRTYFDYFNRTGQPNVHDQLWYFYFQTFFFKAGNGWFWSEGFILLLAVIGVWGVFRINKHAGMDIQFFRFIAFYTLFLILFYTLIPYKTPWCGLNFLHGLILLAGAGGVTLFYYIEGSKFRWISLLIGVAALLQLSWQGFLLNYRYEANPINPYVYGHTSPDLLTLVQRVNEVTPAAPEGKQLYMEVICPGDDYWPLPWYFRAYPNVGWWRQVDTTTAPAPLIICSPAVEPELMYKLYEIPPPGQRNLYLPLVEHYLEIRPGIEIRSYLTKTLWDLDYQHQVDAESDSSRSNLMILNEKSKQKN